MFSTFVLRLASSVFSVYELLRLPRLPFFANSPEEKFCLKDGSPVKNFNGVSTLMCQNNIKLK